MADEQAPKTEKTEAPAGGVPKKVLFIVVGVMALETIGVGAFLMLSGGGAKEAAADVVPDPATDPEALVEVAIVADRFQNLHTGRVWQWECEIVVQVKRKSEPQVTQELERRRAEVTAGIGEVIRKATHTQLREPELASINRRLEAYLNEVFGLDADGQGRVARVLIPKLRGSPADF
jgi:flagellar basal body-associated protein FliL